AVGVVGGVGVARGVERRAAGGAAAGGLPFGLGAEPLAGAAAGRVGVGPGDEVPGQDARVGAGVIDDRALVAAAGVGPRRLVLLDPEVEAARDDVDHVVGRVVVDGAVAVVVEAVAGLGAFRLALHLDDAFGRMLRRVAGVARDGARAPA